MVGDVWGIAADDETGDISAVPCLEMLLALAVLARVARAKLPTFIELLLAIIDESVCPTSWTPIGKAAGEEGRVGFLGDGAKATVLGAI